jgi:hypothetical protein
MSRVQDALVSLGSFVERPEIVRLGVSCHGSALIARVRKLALIEIFALALVKGLDIFLCSSPELRDAISMAGTECQVS